MIDLVLAAALLVMAASGGPAVLLPLGAFCAAIATARLVSRYCRGRPCRSQYGPEKGLQVTSAAIGIQLGLTGFASVPLGLASLGAPANSPPALALGAVLAAACWLRFSLSGGNTAGATPLRPRRLALAGLAAAAGLTAATAVADALLAQLADVAAMMLVALLATAAGVRLAIAALLDLIDAALPPAADAALRERLAETLSTEPVAAVRTRRAAGRLYLDIALSQSDGSAASDLWARAARLRERVGAEVAPGADLTVRIAPLAADRR